MQDTPEIVFTFLTVTYVKQVSLNKLYYYFHLVNVLSLFS